MDRITDILFKSQPQWHLRQVESVLCEEDWGDGAIPMHKDINTVGDVLRIGAPALAMRFREVDPDVWEWFIEELEKHA